jgi:hypothetical protein
MADLYGSNAAIGGVFKGTKVELTLGKGGGAGGLKGAMAQNVNISYSRNVTRVWELGSDDTYYILGHTEGQAQMARIVAKKSEDILDQLADACSAKDNTLNLRSTAQGCEQNDTLGLIMKGPILTNRSFTMDVNQFVMSSTAALMFAGLEKSSR